MKTIKIANQIETCSRSHPILFLFCDFTNLSPSLFIPLTLYLFSLPTFNLSRKNPRTTLSAVTSACPTPSTKPPPPPRLNQSLSLLSFCESPLYVPLHRPSFSMADLDDPQIKSRDLDMQLSGKREDKTSSRSKASLLINDNDTMSHLNVWYWKSLSLYQLCFYSFIL
ncbi:unnamed protein product [Thlaspi arvense]|uniref:Uncharacterized protein n=1 Tax=Thlaspi arvense TaxID=13288 RepID=A0AAU9SVP1_THLAR|nr:unnamed protein product [Thlaspi arvense]